MADTKISDLAALASPATGDLLPVVDVSDTSMAASGTDKKLTLADLRTLMLLGAAPPQETLLQTCAQIPAVQATGTYWWTASSTGVIASGSGSSTSLMFVVLDSADWPDIDNLRLDVSLLTNADQAGVTFTFGLYPIAVGGTTSIIPTMGTVVPGSTVAFVAPADNSENRGTSGEFAFPAADAYVIGVVISGTTTAGSSRTAACCALKGLRA